MTQLKKINKIEKCENISAEYEVTSSGIKGAMDTATFESFCSACTAFFKQLPATDGKCERHTRRLCHALHVERFRQLPQLVVKRKRNNGKRKPQCKPAGTM